MTESHTRANKQSLTEETPQPCASGGADRDDLGLGRRSESFLFRNSAEMKGAVPPFPAPNKLSLLKV